MKQWIGLITMVLGLGCGSGQDRTIETTPRSAVRVNAETVRLTQVPVTVMAVGTTEPYAQATPGTRLLGQVARVAVEEGQRVVKGQVLVRIENRDLAARRQQSASALKEAQAVLSNAEIQVQRMRNLHRENAVSRQKLDDAETVFERAQAGVVTAQGALGEVEANLGYTTVRAPIDGVVVRTFVDPGDMAAPGAPLFTIERQNPMKVTVAVSEQDLAFIEVGGVVHVSVEASESGRMLMGKVETLIPSADPQSRTFEVQVVLSNSDYMLRSGMFARVLFQKDTRPGVLIPAEACIKQGQLQGVYVIDGDYARLRWIRLGKNFGEKVEVLSGLDADERIAVTQLDKLCDGCRVEVGSDG